MLALIILISGRYYIYRERYIITRKNTQKYRAVVLELIILCAKLQNFSTYSFKFSRRFHSDVLNSKCNIWACARQTLKPYIFATLYLCNNAINQKSQQGISGEILSEQHILIS